MHGISLKLIRIRSLDLRVALANHVSRAGTIMLMAKRDLGLRRECCLLPAQKKNQKSPFFLVVFAGCESEAPTHLRLGWKGFKTIFCGFKQPEKVRINRYLDKISRAAFLPNTPKRKRRE